MPNKEDNITSWFAEQSDACADMFPIGIGDDMAQAIVGKDASVLVTTDMLLEGVHFELDKISVEQAGYKAMAVSLSDCAAMATVPVFAVVSVALPSGADDQMLKDLHDGIKRAGDQFGCVLIGGDITAWRKDSSDKRMVINSTIISKPCNVEPVKRSGAKVGDVICVTGPLGGSINGKHATFIPRVKEAIAFAETVTINAMMDISDGLSTDLNRICKASGVGAVLTAEQIPISDDVPAGQFGDRLNAALNDGEDFELLLTLTRSEYEKIGNSQLFIVGTIVEGDNIEINIPDGTVKKVIPAGFDHL